MKEKITIFVLMGGNSPEHDVSIASGKQVVKNLNKKKYDVLPVVISKDGKRWFSITKGDLDKLDSRLKDEPGEKEIVLLENRQEINPQSLGGDGPAALVFVALHGRGGEDGAVQGLLDLMGLSYTGSGILASALGMDKLKFRKLMQSEDILIPKYLAIRKNFRASEIEKNLKGYPMFVKPNCLGSSVGTCIAKTKKDLERAIKIAFGYGEIVLVDEYLSGLEVTCAVVGNEKPRALPVVEIRPLKGEYFDYKSKYTESGAEEIVPARISKSLTKKIQKIAVKVHKLVGCRGFSRVDFILKEGEIPVVLEINTIPGLTPMSLFPKAAKAAGIGYPKLLDEIIKYALET